MGKTALESAAGLLARATARIAPWHKWPFLVQLLTLFGTRVNMRWANLFDTYPQQRPKAPAPDVDILAARTADGSHNDLADPAMGMAGVRFGRNFPINQTYGCEGKALLEPNPRTISNQLLARREFVPVPHLNVLISGWLQFMVHDWMSHGKNTKEEPYELPLEPGDDWPQGSPMRVLRGVPDAMGPGDEGRPATYTNTETHWWDGSQIYGSSLRRQKLIRTDPVTGLFLTDGKIGLRGKGNLPICPSKDDVGDVEGGRFEGQELAGISGNWWVGLSVFQTLFAREHNAIVDRLKAEYPAASGEWLFQKARLVNAALIAKIHTTEWTPALMNSPTGRLIMRTNWWGLAGEHFTRGYGRFDDNEENSGIMGSDTDHHAAPFSMTEEFVACYRMHSLIPEEFSFRRAHDDVELLKTDMAGVSHGRVSSLYDRFDFDDILYSLATSHPGALVLHNYPNFLRQLPANEKGGAFNDIAAIDILRDRERGIPRYCAFRRMMGLSAPKSFDELSTNKDWCREVAAIYDDIEQVDLLVGTLCESVGGTPVGFGFSDTVFHIFILMASRRLKSDRFYTSDFRPEVYTQVGFDYIADNSLRTVFERHCPSLIPRFAETRNPFFPWARGAA